MKPEKLTHLDSTGEARMVDVGEKDSTRRVARAGGRVRMTTETREQITGETNPKIRADMVYFKTPHNGGVFSVGSMAWCGSLSHNNCDNNVSRITKNVIDGFLRDGPLP